MRKKVKDFVILIVIFSILVKLSYQGIVGSPFAVFLSSMVPM